MPCPELPNPLTERAGLPPIEPPEPEEPVFDGWFVTTDAHMCNPETDRHHGTVLEVCNFTWCDDPECGGPGGYIVEYCVVDPWWE